jgi:hypothetical protein
LIDLPACTLLTAANAPIASVISRRGVSIITSAALIHEETSITTLIDLPARTLLTTANTPIASVISRRGISIITSSALIHEETSITARI